MNASRGTRNRIGRTRLVPWRVRNEPRRAEERHFVVLLFTGSNAQVTDSGQCQLRILVARNDRYACQRSVPNPAHSSSVVRPSKTAQQTPYSQRTVVACIRVFAQLSYRPNALTLSCKSRLPCRPPGSGAAAAATNAQQQERTAADVTRACSSEPPEAAPPPSQGSAVFVSL